MIQTLKKLLLVKFQLLITTSSLFKKFGFVIDTVTVYVNEALSTRSFPDSLTCANVRPIYKKEDTFDKRNYRPVCILPLLSKVYERLIIYEQASNYFKPFFSMKLCVDLEKHKKHIVLNMLYLNY